VSSHRIKLARYSRGGWRQCAHLCRLAAQQPHSVWVQILLGHVGAEQDRHGIVAVDLRHNPLVPLFLLIECVELSLHVRIKVRQPLLQTWRGGAASRTSSGIGPPRVLAVWCVCVCSGARERGPVGGSHLQVLSGLRDPLLPRHAAATRCKSGRGTRAKAGWRGPGRAAGYLRDFRQPLDRRLPERAVLLLDVLVDRVAHGQCLAARIR
jgi:hypothetical protein